jgi:hypothetical protein
LKDFWREFVSVSSRLEGGNCMYPLWDRILGPGLSWLNLACRWVMPREVNNEISPTLFVYLYGDQPQNKKVMITRYCECENWTREGDDYIRRRQI